MISMPRAREEVSLSARWKALQKRYGVVITVKYKALALLGYCLAQGRRSM